jgi:hypothetical protein
LKALQGVRGDFLLKNRFWFHLGIDLLQNTETFNFERALELWKLAKKRGGANPLNLLPRFGSLCEPQFVCLITQNYLG